MYSTTNIIQMGAQGKAKQKNEPNFTTLAVVQRISAHYISSSALLSERLIDWVEFMLLLPPTLVSLKIQSTKRHNLRTISYSCQCVSISKSRAQHYDRLGEVSRPESASYWLRKCPCNGYGIEIWWLLLYGSQDRWRNLGNWQTLNTFFRKPKCCTDCKQHTFTF